MNKQQRRVPRLQLGRMFRVVEPTGARVLLRWRCRLEGERRWHPDDVADGSGWHRYVSWPDTWGVPDRDRWRYCFTRRGAQRVLDREERRRARKRALRAAREETRS